MQISVSFLKSLNDTNSAIKLIEDTDADFIHVDVMDGVFVDNKSLSIEECSQLLMNTKKMLDVHLMVTNPLPYINFFKNLNTKYITIHVEIDNVDEYLDLIKGYGISAGLAINPETDVHEIDKYLNKLDLILIMSVHPGRGGQSFIMDVLPKIDYLKSVSNALISIDGGVNNETRKYLNNLDILVSGSYICMSENFQEKINSLR